MDREEARRLRHARTIERNKNERLLKKNAELLALTEETSDTQNFLRHRERQMQALQNRCNRYSGAMRAYLQSGRRAALEEALEPQPEDEWRTDTSRGRYRGQAAKA